MSIQEFTSTNANETITLKDGDSVRIEYIGDYYAHSINVIKVEKIIDRNVFVTQHGNIVYSFYGVFHEHGTVSYGSYDNDHTVLHFVCYRNSPLNKASITYTFNDTVVQWLKYVANTFPDKWGDENLEPSKYLINIT